MKFAAQKRVMHSGPESSTVAASSTVGESHSHVDPRGPPLTVAHHQPTRMRSIWRLPANPDSSHWLRYDISPCVPAASSVKPISRLRFHQPPSLVGSTCVTSASRIPPLCKPVLGGPNKRPVTSPSLITPTYFSAPRVSPRTAVGWWRS
ncbi:hypothetical protein Vretimale_447 [Volvox reticuliferus]|uniref:Uncharacterized protein n=1 Tax=Volvox reticuliferus TaxID=1737510 RepID=A0A8J4D2H8_9CHLO|nr:hypothetical protein Vretimale_447 [Volvox reticuliferus]